MFDVKFMKEFNKAIAKEENWFETGPNWDFVEADMYMGCKIKTREENLMLERMFDHLAKEFEFLWGGLDFKGYTAECERIDEMFV